MIHFKVCINKILLLFVPVICLCYEIEINLSDTKNGMLPVKIICNAFDEKTNAEEDHKVLWKGREFGLEDKHKLINSADKEHVIPNVTIKSTDEHKCYILTPLQKNDKEKVKN